MTSNTSSGIAVVDLTTLATSRDVQVSTNTALNLAPGRQNYRRNLARPERLDRRSTGQFC